MMDDKRGLLRELFDVAVAAAHPGSCLASHLPPAPRGGRLIVLGAGKAAASMASVAERHYRETGELARIAGVLTPPHGYAELMAGGMPEHLRILSGRHPSPDASSEAAAREALRLAATAGADDEVLVLLSGGASALWAAPAGIDLAAKTALTRGLLKSGADIHEMNVVRRHVSRIKGGRLALAAHRARRILTLAISDVDGDDPATIGSGPTVPDPSTLADALAVLDRLTPRIASLDLAPPPEVRGALGDPANETPKPGDAAFARADYRIIATPRDALAAAATRAQAAGYRIIDLGDAVTGEAREVAAEHARMAIDARRNGEKVAILSGGELQVTVRNRDGRGGRSQEYALALAIAIAGEAGIRAIAADTDGIDGGGGLAGDAAGAIVDGDFVARARLRHLDAQSFLDNNDATPLLAALDALVVTGPTQTNVNDFRAILVDPDA